MKSRATLPNEILRFCHKESLFTAGSRIVAGVSGGADSIAMLHLLHGLSNRLGIELVVAHLNHHLRGHAAKVDERFVAECAAALGLRYYGGSAYVRERASRRKLSIETAARQARQEFFRRIVRQTDSAGVALAHTADDQVETFLLRLLRGSAMSGLTAMDPITSINGLHVFRPLLQTKRETLIHYLKKSSIHWREESSNLDPVHTRNRVRHSLLPLLEDQFSPAIRKILLRTVGILREEDRLLELITADYRKKLQAPDDRLDINGLRCLPEALQRRIIRQWLALSSYGKITDSSELDRIVRWAASRRAGGLIELSEGLGVVAEYDHLSLVSMKEQGRINAQQTQSLCAVHVPRTGTTIWPPGGLRVITWTAPGVWKEKPSGVARWPCRATVSLERAGRRRLRLRSRQPGDRFFPLGMKGSRKVQDIFTDARVPLAQRDNIPLIVCGEEIIWIPGYQVARGWEVRDPQCNAQHIVIEKMRSLK